MVDATKLSTPRLRLPPLTRGHTEELVAMYRDPDVARYIGGDRLTDEVIPLQVADFADEWQARGYGQSAVLLRDSGAFVGRIGLHYWPEWDEVELGYILKHSAQGSGLATEGARAWLDWAKTADEFDHLTYPSPTTRSISRSLEVTSPSKRLDRSGRRILHRG